MVKDTKPEAATSPLELLDQLDAPTLDAAIAEAKAKVAAAAGKLRQLELLRKSVAFRNGEIKRGVRKKKAAADKPAAEASPETAPKLAAVSSDDAVEAIRSHLRTAGPCTPLEIAQATAIGLPVIKAALLSGPFGQRNGKWTVI